MHGVMQVVGMNVRVNFPGGFPLQSRALECCVWVNGISMVKSLREGS